MFVIDCQIKINNTCTHAQLLAATTHSTHKTSTTVRTDDLAALFLSIILLSIHWYYDRVIYAPTTIIHGRIV